jgi:hypothetical protein
MSIEEMSYACAQGVFIAWKFCFSPLGDPSLKITI